MFHANPKTLTLSFNEFHDLSDARLPEYGEYCLLELKNGDLAAGGWLPSGGEDGVAGRFLRGTADTVDAKEVARWHSLDRYDLSEVLEDEEMGWINLGPGEEDGRVGTREENEVPAYDPVSYQ
ncbi:MAG: hypothetical protein K5891_01210 [Lachnospiraceae bacterium]|nr:hypothetical protein [Lachnospiraceae bacterium]